jgi:hypothetical protein
MAVNAAAGDGWELAGNGTETVTAAPADPVPGTAVTIALEAANKEGGDEAAEVPEVTVMPVSGVFSRPEGGTVTYTLAYYDSNGAAGLNSPGGGTAWHYVADGALRARFNAVYAPNAPGTGDNIESGKTAVAYNEAMSGAVLGLFSITLGPNAGGSGDLYEIKGTGLPAANAGDTLATTGNPIVIDVGLPGEDNSGLPVFYIPHQGLGAEAGSYGYIRFRVNSGASVMLLSENSGYINGSPGDSSATGYFNYGCIEVMGGGKLRDGAYEGFPLGASAVILNRLGSYLGIGPEEGSADAVNSKVSDVYDNYYKGWLIGPSGGNPRIAWDGGDQGSYIEVRPGKLAISANVTVKKSMGLIYDAWFVNGPAVTIDAAGYDLEIDGKKGLFANSPYTYKFYGTKDASGGENAATPVAEIVIKPGSTLHKAFLTDEAADAAVFITNSTNADITIKNKGGSGGVQEKLYETGTGITGYLNWDIPDADPDGGDDD